MLSEDLSFSNLLFYAIFGAVLSIFCFLDLDESSGIPDTSKLLTAQGAVSNVSRYKYGVTFNLSGESRNFEYPSKAKGMEFVYDSLVGAGEQKVEVLYALEHDPSDSVETYVNVWEISIGDRRIRSLSQSIEGWKSDNALRPWIGTCFGLIAASFAVGAYRAKRGTSALK